MSIHGEGSFWRRLRSPAGFTSVAHVFVMEWAAVIRDIVGGLLIAGAIAAWVPDSFWQHFFFTSHPLLSKIWGPLTGPLVSVFSFVCSIGNVPLAAVLWNGGISFGGVISFVFADLIIIPILVIYRKYYGTKMMLFILWTFYVTMAVAGYLVEIIFGVLHLIPATRNAQVLDPHISWNYTTVLNLIFLALAAALLWRFFRTGGRQMLAMMNGAGSWGRRARASPRTRGLMTAAGPFIKVGADQELIPHLIEEGRRTAAVAAGVHLGVPLFVIARAAAIRDIVIDLSAGQRGRRKDLPAVNRGVNPTGQPVGHARIDPVVSRVNVCGP
jgi:Predicted permease